MNCPHCQQPLETGAAFCGNCGQPITPAVTVPVAAVSPAPIALAAVAPTIPPPLPIAQVLQNQSAPVSTPQPLGQPITSAASGLTVAPPSYALATPAQQHGEKQAWLALLFGIAGIVGALFMAVIGLVLGILGIIMGTTSHSGSKRGISFSGLIASSLAVLISLAVWAYAIQHDPKLHPSTAKQTAHNITAPTVSSPGLLTPCYSAGFINKFNVSNNASSCDMEAFNGSTLSSSTEVYKVYADTSQVTNPANFTGIAKPAIEKDLKDNLPGFTINTERVTTFASSPAYVVNSSDTIHHVAIVEAAVLHKVATGNNVFILVHADNGNSTDLNILEAQWRWR